MPVPTCRRCRLRQWVPLLLSGGVAVLGLTGPRPVPSWAAEAASAASAPAAVGMTTPAPSLAEILMAAHGLRQLQGSIERQLEKSSDLTELEAQIGAAESTVRAGLGELGISTLRQADFIALVNLDTETAALERGLTRAVSRLAASATAFDDDLASLSRASKQWAQRAEVAAQLDTPPLVVSLLLLTVFAPQAPVAFYSLVWLLLSVPAAMLARRVLARPLWRSLYALVLVLCLLPFRSVLEIVPFVDRMVLLLQAAVLSGVLAVDERRGRFGRAR